MNKKYIRILMLLILLPILIACQTGPEQSAAGSDAQELSQFHIDTMEQLLDDLKQIASQSSQSNVKSTFDLVEKETNEGRLTFAVDPELNPTLWGTASFSLYEKPRGDSYGYISVNAYLLDIYNEHKATVLGIVFHEFQHVSDYITQPDLFALYHENKLEEFLFEMDACYLQTLLLEQSLLAGYTVDSAYMELLLTSNKEDQLTRLAGELFGYNKDLVYYIYSLNYEVMQGETSQRDYISRVQLIGEELQGYTFEGIPPYDYLCSVYSYAIFTGPLLSGSISDDWLDTAEIASINNSINYFNQVIKDYEQEFLTQQQEFRDFYDL